MFLLTMKNVLCGKEIDLVDDICSMADADDEYCCFVLRLFIRWYSFSC